MIKILNALNGMLGGLNVKAIESSSPMNKCVFVLYPLINLYKEGRKQASSFASKTGQADFRNWVFFLPSNLMDEISLNTEALSAIT